MRVKPRILLGILDGRDPTLSWINVLRSTTGYLLLTTFIVWTLAYQCCRFISYRDPTSFFFDPRHGYERRYSLLRERQAYDFIKAANITPPTAIEKPQDPFLCVGIATIARTSAQQYVRGTIGSLLEGLSQDERQSIYLMPLIAHTEPTDHPIRHEPWLSAISNRVLEYEVSEQDLTMLRNFEEGHHFRNKSMYDYGYLLQKCFDTGAPWVAMLEDDVLARAGWYPKAQRAVSRLQSEENAPWLYLRLFYTEGLLGWNSEEWPRYFGWSMLTLITILSVLVGVRAKSTRLHRILSYLNILVICLVILPAFVGLYFMAGRMTVQPPAAGVHKMNRFGCCSQGFIFPQDMVPPLIERTKKAMNEDYYVDMLLERWANAESFNRFVLVPPLLQHVGAKSSKGGGYDESAGTTWSFAFEDHPP